MAKFAQIGYGSDGRTNGREPNRNDGIGYTYVVDDKVRKGDMITPVVRHAGNGNVFVTTGKVMSTAKQISRMRQNGESIADQLGDELKDIGAAYEKDGKLEVDKGMLTRQPTRQELGMAQPTSKAFGQRDSNGAYQPSGYGKVLRGGSLEDYLTMQGGTPSTKKNGESKEALAAYDAYKPKGQVETYEEYTRRFTKE